MLSYNEFKKLAPKETVEFVDFALPYLDYYAKDNRFLFFRRLDNSTNNYYSKYFFLLLYAMAQNSEYENFFSKFGFEKERVKVDKDSMTSKKTKEELFTLAVPNFEDTTKYETLTPIDIFMPVLDGYWNQCGQTIYDNLFPRIKFGNFKNELMSYNQAIKAEQERKLEQGLYGNLPITVISYLETASKIRSLLFQKVNSTQTEILKRLEEDIVPVSLVLAAYYYKDTPIYIEENVSEQTAIKDFLSTKGITLDKILQNLSIGMGVREVTETPRNLIAIKNLYREYCSEGYFHGKEQDTVTVRGILENVFNREFTDSVAVEKLFARMNCYIGMFENFDRNITQHIETQKRNYSAEYVKSFYGDLPKEAREFADFTAKIYLLLLQKMKENKHNSKLLFAEDDADTLALLIATYYFDGDVSEFFKDYGITLEKILELLNITLTKEEIEAVELNQKVLVDRYRRFFYEGVNRNKMAKSLTVNDIAHNLCNRNFNRSIIMESIFSELTDEMDLESDFLNQLQNHLSQKEQKRKMKLTQRLFRDIPVDTIEILENASRIHTYLEKQLTIFPREDLKSLSLLLGLLFSSNNEIKEFLGHLGFSISSICSYLKINGNSLLNEPIDIDLLTKEYGNYIFGGKNKDKKREELTPKELAKNIFTKEINNSVSLSKFLANFHQSYDSYAQFEENYQSYIEKTREKKRRDEAISMIRSYTSADSYLFNVFKIHRIIDGELQNGKLQTSFISSEDDIKELSMILGLFYCYNSSKEFFVKNNITLENILKTCGLDSTLFDRLSYLEVDLFEGRELYRKYLEKDQESYRSRRTADDFAKRIFDNSINTSMFLENLATQLGANYDILKEEVETGQDYELSLTIDDRISLLAAEAIDSLDLSDIKSVLHFGNSLSIHSKYIHDELPKLMLSDVHQASIDTINSIINRVCEKQEDQAPQKKGWLARLFAISVDEPSTPKYVLNPSAIEELKGAIDSNISTLSRELLGYDAIRKYIEVYRRKNRTHYMVASDTVSKLQEELGTLDPHKDEEYERFLTASSRLQIMTDKSNRFATTNHLMQQELLKVNQAIVNHFITINALEMARDDLLPLVGSELALGKGRSTENQSLELSQNVMQLFQSLLDRNVDSAVHNMEQLRHSNLSSTIFESLNQDIQVYLQGLNQASHIEERIEYLDIDQLSEEFAPAASGFPNPGEISLTLTPTEPKQKKLGTMPVE